MPFVFLYSPKSNERNVKQRPACLGAVICDWRLGRRRVGLGDHLQRVVTHRPRGSSGGWNLNSSQEKRRHPQRQGSGRPVGLDVCQMGGKGLASRQQLSVRVLITGQLSPGQGDGTNPIWSMSNWTLTI